jgi:hypothetical protein
VTQRVVGIDVGLSGALCLVDTGGVRACVDMPVVLLGGKGHVKRKIAAGDVAVILRALTDGYRDETMVVIEKQQPFGIEGRASLASLMHSYGVLEGVCSGLGLHAQHVIPERWKAFFGLRKIKAQSIEKVQQYYHHTDLGIDQALQRLSPITLRKHDGRAEACLLALYGWNVLR